MENAFIDRVSAIETEDNFNPINGLEDQNPFTLPDFDSAITAACTNTELNQKNLSTNIKCAKLAAKKLAKTNKVLSEDQIAAIHLYTQESPFYRTLNKTLRERDRKKLRPFFMILRLLLSALYSLPPVKMTVYRGVKMALWEHFDEEDEKIWWSVTSTTSQLSVLSEEMFLGLTGERTLFAIETEWAVDISGFSAMGNEKELLLPPGSHLKVVSKLQTGSDCWMIQMRQEPYEHLIQNCWTAPGNVALAQDMELLKMDVKKMEEQKKFEEQKKMLEEEKKHFEEQKKKLEWMKIEEEKKITEQKKMLEAQQIQLEEQKKMLEHKKMEEQKKILEQKKMEEQKKVLEQKKIEEQKKMFEAQNSLKKEEQKIQEIQWGSKFECNLCRKSYYEEKDKDKYYYKEKYENWIKFNKGDIIPCFNCKVKCIKFC